MTSLKKLEANRLNGSKSKGPISFNGKRWSSKNAIKHGLTAAQSCLTIGENVKEYNEFVRNLNIHYSPFDHYSQTLFEILVNIHWKIRRIPKIESGIYAYEIQTHEADKYKAEMKDEIHHQDFEQDDKTRVHQQNLFYGVAFLKDAEHSNALIKLSTHETKLINKLNQIEKMYYQHKEKFYASKKKQKV